MFSLLRPTPKPTTVVEPLVEVAPGIYADRQFLIATSEDSVERLLVNLMAITADRKGILWVQE